MNIHALNLKPLNTGKLLQLVEEGILVFNGIELCDQWGNIRALSINDQDLPSFELNTYKSALIDWGGVISHLVDVRNITIELYIQWDDKEDFYNRVLAFKKQISRREAPLIITVGSTVMQTKASVISFERNEFIGEAGGRFTLNLRTVENYQDQTPTYQAYPSIVGDIQVWIVNEGHRQTDLSFYLAFTNAVLLDDVTVEVNWFPITVNYSFSPWDILFIDSDTGRTEVNGTLVEFDGVIPSIETNFDLAWFNPVEFKFTLGSTVDVDITAFYTKQYL